MKKRTGKIIECDHFEKEIKLIKAYSIIMKDESGEVNYTFDSEKKRDQFYKTLKDSLKI